MDVFSVRDLRERTGEIVHDAEAGKLSLVTKHGHPVFLALPFSEELIQQGLGVMLGLQLYKEGILSLEKASKIAKLSVEAFIEKLGSLGVPVVNYSPEDIEEELLHFDKKNNNS